MAMQIQRRILPSIREHMSAPEMTLLVGARQVGKTTLIRMLLDGLKSAGKQTVFFNLDIEEDMHWFSSQRAFLDRLNFLVGTPASTVYVAIDEIQRKADAGRFMKGLYDMGLPYKFILSGSGSLELKEQITESMMGRKREFFIPPVSFAEFVDYRTDYAYSDRLDVFAQSEGARCLGLLIEYLNYGGYPKVILSQGRTEKLAVLREIYTSYVDRDISAFLRLARPDAYRQMLALLASQSGQLLNVSTLAAQTGVGVETLKRYTYYAEKTFCVSLVRPYFRNVQKEITKSPVPYFFDLGLRNLVLGRLGLLENTSDLGFAFQNFVYQVLIDVFGVPSVKYWRTTDQAEVDFVVEDSSHGGLLPVEVKYMQMKKPVVMRSLQSFIAKYKPKEAWVINLSLANTVMIGDTQVRFVPLAGLFANVQGNRRSAGFSAERPC